MTTNLRVIYVKTSTIAKFHRYNLGVKWCCLYIKYCLIGVFVQKFNRGNLLRIIQLKRREEK